MKTGITAKIVWPCEWLHGRNRRSNRTPGRTREVEGGARCCQQRAAWSVPLSLVHHGEIRDFVLVVDHEDDGTAFRRFDQLFVYVRPDFIGLVFAIRSSNDDPA